MERIQTPPPPPVSLSYEQEKVSAFLRQVYNWMAGGLALTGVVAWLSFQSQFIMQALFTPTGPSMLFWVLCIAELGMVFWLSARVHKMQASTAAGIFILYAGLNGITLSWIFLAYTGQSLVSTFLVTGGTFAVTSIWGYTTKRDLSGVGSFLTMGLFGIIIASLVNLWLKSPMLTWIVTYLGIAIFVGLTAWDTQKLKKFATGDYDEQTGSKAAVMGALSLYLDFINLFLLLLRVMGDRR